MRGYLENIIHKTLEALIPRYCTGCKKPNEAFCGDCKKVSYKTGAQCPFCGFRNKTGKICNHHLRSPFLTEERKEIIPMNQILWAGNYNGALKDAIWQLKYKKRKEIAVPLGAMLAEKFKEVFPKANPEHFLAIPVPLHFKKEHERGFNQAELLAKEFSRFSSVSFLTNLLLKIKDTAAQVKTPDKETRLKNLEKAFEINPKLSASDLKLLISNTLILIDDVSTTGATLMHAAKALTGADLPAKKIIGLVAAHGGS